MSTLTFFPSNLSLLEARLVVRSPCAFAGGPGGIALLLFSEVDFPLHFLRAQVGCINPRFWAWLLVFMVTATSKVT